MNSLVSASGFVSSYRNTVSLVHATPAPSRRSNANEKFMFMDFACPRCKYPFGSGGNLVLIALPLSAWCSLSNASVLLQVWGPPLCDASGQCLSVRPNNGSVRRSSAHCAREPSCSSGFSFPTHFADGLFAHQARLSMLYRLLDGVSLSMASLCCKALWRRCRSLAAAMRREL